jgi:transketolase
MPKNNIDQKCVNAVRLLAADMVEEANSGHPGMPLGAAPMAYVLWTKFLRHNPKNPTWPNRDRFILSAGHGSALLYAMLHLTGYNLSIDELKRFRQWGSKTPGHPEYGHTPGVEATTGPLGQGFAMGVGMALAERFMASRFNKSGMDVVDHYTYSIVSDGDLMEGITSEAASIAGHQKLGKLIYLYDDNHISIEGDTNLAFTEDVVGRFDSYGWHTQRVSDGNDLAAIEKAIKKAQKEDGKPSIIAIRTHIGFGSPKQDDAGAHGSPLGEDGLRQTKKNLGWSEDKRFYVPDDVRAHFTSCVEDGGKLSAEWQGLFKRYGEGNVEDAKRFEREIAGALSDGWDENLSNFASNEKVATRSASGKIINALAANLPNLIGGSADLAPSNNTIIKGASGSQYDHPEGRNIHFGIREHAMGAIVNGMALHGGVIPYAATFLVFSDYMRPSLRLAALMDTHSMFIFTHDSVGVGEDGPTHQPIEHVMSLRAIPNLTVFRPADANETAAAWRLAIDRKKPAVFALSRQNLPTLDVDKYPVKGGTARGGYILTLSEEKPDIILIATGSEVHLALEAHDELKKKGVDVRVVSMPSWELFEEQSAEYQESVLPIDVKKRVAIEAGVTLGWERYAGDEGRIVGIDRFGKSAPGGEVFKDYGFSVENIVNIALEL